MAGSEERSAEPGASPLERVRQAIQHSQYRDAITVTAKLPPRELHDDQAQPLIDCLLVAAAGLQDDSEDEVTAYNLVVGIGDALAGPESEVGSVQTKVENALFNKAVVLGHQGRNEEAIAVYDDVIHRSSSSAEPRPKEHAARALFNKGARLAGLDRPAQALAAYDELIERFVQSTESKVMQAVAKGMVNRGIALARLARFEEAITAFDDVLILWGSSPEPFFRERAALALLNKATALLKINRPDSALGAYQELIGRYCDDARESMKKQVALAEVLTASVQSGVS
ncbi:MAG: tetratricopeptide repeat protein [Gemmatimonadota bacterium]|nr:tetratricopeptide repeat protein [Candidatus Palauibacterales bacterium]